MLEALNLFNAAADGLAHGIIIAAAALWLRQRHREWLARPKKVTPFQDLTPAERAAFFERYKDSG